MRIWILIQSPTESFLRRNADNALRPDTIALTIPLLMTPILGWLWYEYTDWKNDIFMVTPDEIFDIDRKPFGSEERRAAQVESILSTSYKRDGIIAYAFNYGTVHVSVGGTQLDFENVVDPASVQADINRRRMIRIAQKNENAGKDDRERFATWIAAYHENVKDFGGPVKGPEKFQTGQQAAISNTDDTPMDLDGSDSDGPQDGGE